MLISCRTLASIKNLKYTIEEYSFILLFSFERDVSISFVACIIGGLISIVMVYAWYGVANQHISENNESTIRAQDMYHWISFVFMTFHEASVEGIIANIFIIEILTSFYY